MQPLFYEVFEDMQSPGLWSLGGIENGREEIDAHELRRGEHFQGTGRMMVTVKSAGMPADLSFTLRDVPLASTRVAEIVERLAPGAVERLPVTVSGYEGSYELLNVLRIVDAVDRERSKYLLWKPGDSRADKVGKFRQMERLVIRSDVRQEEGIFRLAGWTISLVISSRLKAALENVNVRGVVYRPLEGGFTAN